MQLSSGEISSFLQVATILTLKWERERERTFLSLLIRTLILLDTILLIRTLILLDDPIQGSTLMTSLNLNPF